MKGEGQIVVARRPEIRASGIGSGLEMSAHLREELPKSLKKTSGESDWKRDIEN